MVTRVKLTTMQLHARAEALESCANHLASEWTNDLLEREQGAIVEERLRKEVAALRLQAQEEDRQKTLDSYYRRDSNNGPVQRVSK